MALNRSCIVWWPLFLKYALWVILLPITQGISMKKFVKWTNFKFHWKDMFWKLIFESRIDIREGWAIFKLCIMIIWFSKKELRNYNREFLKLFLGGGLYFIRWHVLQVWMSYFGRMKGGRVSLKVQESSIDIRKNSLFYNPLQNNTLILSNLLGHQNATHQRY